MQRDVAAAAASSPILELTPGGDKQQVRVLTPQQGTYANITSFESDWPPELLHSLAALKGEWFVGCERHCGRTAI